jgi:general secretion pathway protein I
MAAPCRHGGFTLLEVLVALAILGIALMAALKSSGVVVRNATGLKERTFAHWVAMNRAAELELQATGLELGTSLGRAEMANHTWYWTVATTKTPDPAIRHAVITVAREEQGAPLATLEVFLDRP